MESQKYEQSLNYAGLILKTIDSVLSALQAGWTGEKEIDVLLCIRTPELIESTEAEIRKIYATKTNEIEELKKSWTVRIGTHSNNKFEIQMTPERAGIINELIRHGNRQIISIIIASLSKSGMLLTPAIHMPTAELMG